MEEINIIIKKERSMLQIANCRETNLINNEIINIYTRYITILFEGTIVTMP